MLLCEGRARVAVDFLSLCCGEMGRREGGGCRRETFCGRCLVASLHDPVKLVRRLCGHSRHTLTLSLPGDVLNEDTDVEDILPSAANLDEAAQLCNTQNISSRDSESKGTEKEATIGPRRTIFISIQATPLLTPSLVYRRETEIERSFWDSLLLPTQDHGRSPDNHPLFAGSLSSEETIRGAPFGADGSGWPSVDGGMYIQSW